MIVQQNQESADFFRLNHPSTFRQHRYLQYNLVHFPARGVSIAYIYKVTLGSSTHVPKAN